jgi:hypothetical protein
MAQEANMDTTTMTIYLLACLLPQLLLFAGITLALIGLAWFSDLRSRM